MTFRLIDRIGGRVWPLSSEALVIGRGEACGVRVEDPLASRVHCKVWAEAARVYVEDLGSSNATLVNGAAVQSSEVASGDRLGIGSSVFEIESLDTLASMTNSDDEAETVDLAHALRPHAQDAVEGASPITVAQYQSLFTFGQELGRAADLGPLLDVARGFVEHNFAPDAACVLRYSLQGRYHTNVLIGDPNESIPNELITEAIDTNRGLLLPEIVREGSARRVQTTMLVPVRVHRVPLGAVVVRSHTRRRVYDHADLMFFSTMAQALAPYWRLVEQHDHRRSWEQTDDKDDGIIIGKSASLREALALADRVAGTALSVLLLGETGTGKELFAHRIHAASRRSDGPFVALNCAAIPRDLFESEMFGHDAGAFTGASKRRVGRFEQAHGGTLFLDEIGDLHPENQARLLRAVDTGTFHRVGGSKEVTVDVRFIAATNKPVATMINDGTFRDDLYHRLSGIELHLPPLRDRAEDIPLLAHSFLHAIAQREGGPALRLTDEAVHELQQRRWRGNVRELKVSIERAAMFATAGGVIEPRHLGAAESVDAATPTAGPTPTEIRPLAEIEAHYIRHVVDHYKGNMQEAAKALGIARATLYRKTGLR